MALAISKVRVQGGNLWVMKTNKIVYGPFTGGAAALDAALDQLKAQVTDVNLLVLALKKVGLGNVETLEGKTVTLTIDVDIV